MPRPSQCSVCAHPRRAEVEGALLAGTAPLEQVAAAAGGLSRDGVRRHRDRHLLPQLAEGVEQAGGPALVDELRGLLQTLAGLGRRLDEQPRLQVPATRQAVAELLRSM